MHFQFDDRGLQEYFARWENSLLDEVYQSADSYAKSMEAVAKANAPWKDQSGRARESILGEAISNGSEIEIVLSGDTAYFPYLEFAQEGKYAVLWPTVLEASESVLFGLAETIIK